MAKNQNSRTPELQNSRTPELQNSRTPELQNSRTPELQNSRTPELQNSTTIVPNYKGNVKCFLETQNFNGIISKVEVNAEIHEFEIQDRWKQNWQQIRRKKSFHLKNLSKFTAEETSTTWD